MVGEGRVERFPAARVKTLDTMAAGDIFTDGFTATLTCGLDKAAAARSGRVAVAIPVARLSTQISIPSREEVRRALADEA